MKWLLSKILSIWIYITHSNLSSQYRWFVRQSIISNVYQLKFLVRDYFIRKPYKVIKFNGEFQQELLYVLPHAYWHYKNGTLLKTISSNFTNELYYFSPFHEQLYQERNYLSNESIDIPNAAHTLKLNKLKWIPPPLKKIYQNNPISYTKPILVIANRYNTEWDKEPISYFNLDELKVLFGILANDYQIVYNRPVEQDIINDNSETLELNDFKLIEESHKEVHLLKDLEKIFNLSVKSFNHLQLQVYSKSSNFISVHGGTATLASYFGGQNIILSKKGIEHEMGEFTSVFPAVSGCRTYHAKTFDEVLSFVRKQFLRKHHELKE